MHIYQKHKKASIHDLPKLKKELKKKTLFQKLMFQHMISKRKKNKKTKYPSLSS